MRSLIFICGLFIVIVQNGNAADEEVIAEMTKLQNNVAIVDEQMKSIKELHEKFNHHISTALYKHPVLTSIDKELEDLRLKPINSAHCWYPIKNAIDKFAKDLRKEMPHELDTNMYPLEKKMKALHNILDEIKSKVEQGQNSKDLESKIKEAHTSLREAKELLDTTTNLLEKSFKKFLKKERAPKFRKDVLAPIIDCLSKSQPLDWLSIHLGQLVRSVLL